MIEQERHETPESGGIKKASRSAEQLLVYLMLGIICVLLAIQLYTTRSSESGAMRDVVIVDFGRIASNYPEGASEEEISRLMVEFNTVLQQLSDAGFIVLDAAAVVSAPRDAYLPDDLILEMMREGNNETGE